MNVHKLIGSLGGKKFVAFLITVVTLAMKNFLGLDEDTATKIAAVAASLILGQGFSDGMTGGLTSAQPGTPQWTPPSSVPNA